MFCTVNFTRWISICLSEHVSQELEASLSQIEEIKGGLRIVQAHALSNLHFLKSLRVLDPGDKPIMERWVDVIVISNQIFCGIHPSPLSLLALRFALFNWHLTDKPATGNKVTAKAQAYYTALSTKQGLLTKQIHNYYAMQLNSPQCITVIY